MPSDQMKWCFDLTFEPDELETSYFARTVYSNDGLSNDIKVNVTLTVTLY